MASDVATAPSWAPLGAGDLAAVGCTTCVDVAIALVLVHIVLHQSWPPYKAVLPGLVALSGIAVS